MNIKDILKSSITKHASDLHISPYVPPILRINGDLVPLEEYGKLQPAQTKELIFSIMDESQLQIIEQNFEADFLISLPDFGSFRVNAFKQLHGFAAVFRVIPTLIPTLESINAPFIFRHLLELESGLILLTGPTGSGKTTTLAAMINYVNEHKAAHIITIEDPIEFVHESKNSLINQRQLHKDSLSFSSALRAALREDPDIILVGEMRDLETIRLALTAAETGHLVMATLHASSASRAISRIIDVFPAEEKNIIRNLLAGSLQAAICQTLVKTIHQGRVGAYEVMMGISSVRNLIREDKIAQLRTVLQTSKDKGMCTMEQALMELVEQRLVGEEVLNRRQAMKELIENS